MKKVFTILTITVHCFLEQRKVLFAQAAESVESETFHQVLKQRFIEGGPFLWELFWSR